MAGNDDELERRAVEELLKEASRGRVRSETMGPSGWMKCPLRSTNKRFLLNTLRPCAAERRPGSRPATARGTERSREEGSQ
ncbi:DNA-directed RNA polymerases I and III subunit RPAC2-like, partial [Clarias magur]